MKHFKYASYVLRHKLFVGLECFKVGLFWRGLVHDLSKLRPSEWLPYARHFYGHETSKARDRTGTATTATGWSCTSRRGCGSRTSSAT